MKSTNLHRSVRRNLAALRIQAPDQRELAWQQYGLPIVDRYPPETWRDHLQRVPVLYREAVRTRLIREAGITFDLTPLEAPRHETR